VSEKVVRFADFERRSAEPDSVAPRDPCEADVIFFPTHPAWREGRGPRASRARAARSARSNEKALCAGQGQALVPHGLWP
jgi:hypothetical protein